MKEYDHKKIEKHWQKEWKESQVYKTDSTKNKEKFYILDMFPYPSGEGLHVGHPKGYIATDIVSRMKRMQGFNVLHPMGFDAFGLPAENYAIKTQTNPMDSVEKNVARYKEQLEIMGFDYDWSREINTTDPKFYKWTQWIFLKLLEKGLAYESYEPINWCPSCKTGLANEDVEDGLCERCSTPVEKKPMRQWVLRITDYAERLLTDLDALDWPESIKESQRNWIGRSEGALIDFKIQNRKEIVKVFTTRPDTLFGVTYVVVAPEHDFVTEIIKDMDSISNRDEVIEYAAKARVMTQIERTDAKKDKTGVKLDGVFAINPANGESVPVYVADYVLAEYGTGAVMAVPSHDERDFQFAKTYGLPIRSVIAPRRIDHSNPHVEGKEIVFRKGILAIIRDPKTNKFLCLKWKKQPWTTFIVGGIEGDEDPVEAARREVFEETGYKNLTFIKHIVGPVQSEFFAAHKDLNRVAHSWTMLFELDGSEPEKISDEEAEKHEFIWLEEKDITVQSMNHSEMDLILERFNSKGKAITEEGILIDSGNFSGLTSEEAKKKITESVGGEWVVKFKLKEWVFSRQRYWGEPFPLLHDGDKIVPVSESDLPVELPKVSSYEPTGTGESPLAGVEKWVNVNFDGKEMKRETDTMPQWAGSSWYYLRYMDPDNSEKLVDPEVEKYWNQVDFYVGGAEHATRHLIYARFWHKFLYDIGVVSTTEPFKHLQSVGLIMGEDGRKMGKRYGNVVNPDDIVHTYGADTLRIYEMFMGPFDQAIAWSTGGIMGSRRFIERVWNMQEKVSDDESISLTKETEILLHKTILKLTNDISGLHHNTAISALMILSNAFDELSAIPKNAYESLIKLFAPFAPHVTEDIWSNLGYKESIHISAWPEADKEKIADEEITIAVQVNGKTRAIFKAPKKSDKEFLEKTALALDDVKKWVGDMTPKKVIVVPDRMVSIVL